MSDSLLSIAETAALLGISRTAFWSLRSSGRFPPPADLGARSKRWRLTDVEAFIDARCRVERFIDPHPGMPRGKKREEAAAS